MRNQFLRTLFISAKISAANFFKIRNRQKLVPENSFKKSFSSKHCTIGGHQRLHRQSDMVSAVCLCILGNKSDGLYVSFEESNIYVQIERMQNHCEEWPWKRQKRRDHQWHLSYRISRWGQSLYRVSRWGQSGSRRQFLVKMIL